MDEAANIVEMIRKFKDNEKSVFREIKPFSILPMPISLELPLSHLSFFALSYFIMI